MEDYYFKWPDYLVLAITLALSAAVGFYYACTGDKQRTTNEYLLAGRNMHWFPVACSLVASFISSITLLGQPGEMYSFGTMYMYIIFGAFFAIMVSSTFCIPVFENLQILSLFKYIELRFGKPLKFMAVISSILFLLLYNALVIYGPALSVAAVTGINIWVAILSIALVAILYTVLGGLKAVLWTDTLQLIIMLSGVILVLIVGSINEGGFAEVWRVNKLSGRLDMLEPSKVFDFDPRMRHTFWGLTSLGIIINIKTFGYNQAALQRVLSLRTSKDIKLVYGLTATCFVFFVIVCGLLGLVVFAHNRLCDPIENGQIFSKDQLYPLYVMQLFGHLPGLPGLVLSSIFSASLSTVSSNLNASTLLILEDFVKVCRPNLSERQATILSKVLSLVLGAFSIVLVLFARYFGFGILSMGLTFGSMFGAPTFAVFTLGILVPVAKGRAASIGFICGALYSGWLGFGGLIYKPYVYKYPVTTIGCNVTDLSLLANLTSPVYDPSTWNPQSHYRSGISAMYDISYVWVGPGGALVTLVVSLILSLILDRDDDELIDKRLFSPVIFSRFWFMPKSWRAKIDYRDENKVDVEVRDELLLTDK